MLYSVYLSTMIVLMVGSIKVVAVEINFNLRNKSDTELKLYFINRDLINSEVLGGPVGPFVVEPQHLYERHLNIRNLTKLIIQFAHSDEQYEVEFTRGKTIFLNWCEGKQPKLYPQRGRYRGITKKTRENYSRKNNVQQKDIIKLN